MVGQESTWFEWILISYFEDVQLSDVYKLVREKVEKERPELANKMTSNLGFVEIHHSKCKDLCNVFILELH